MKIMNSKWNLGEQMEELENDNLKELKKLSNLELSATYALMEVDYRSADKIVKLINKHETNLAEIAIVAGYFIAGLRRTPLGIQAQIIGEHDIEDVFFTMVKMILRADDELSADPR